MEVSAEEFDAMAPKFGAVYAAVLKWVQTVPDWKGLRKGW